MGVAALLQLVVVLAEKSDWSRRELGGSIGEHLLGDLGDKGDLGML